MKRHLRPVRTIGGTLRVPGDKSIGHRAALLSILSKGPITVSNFPDSEDCLSSLAAAKAFGVTVTDHDGAMTLTPPGELKIAPETIIDCRNSGTTARLLAGIAAGSGIEVTLTGDDSLRARPMRRVIDPLTEMGAEIFAADGRLPMKIRGRRLLPYEYHLPVASAQVKSAVLLAGLASSCSVRVREDVITRDHTEIMLAHLGEGITITNVTPAIVLDPDDPRKKRREMPQPFRKEIALTGQAKINGGAVDIPGDISTAAFFMAAAAISGQTVTIENVGLNHTRTAFIEYLRQIGCRVEIAGRVVLSGEPRGNVTVTGGPLNARRVSGAATVGLIDEIPIVAVTAAFASGTTIIRDASELRVKESDRLAAIAGNLKVMGVKCGLLDDGLVIEGGKDLPGADFRSFGDHRIAMAFSVAAMFLVGPSTIDDDSVVAVSCPGFYELMGRIEQ